MCIRDRVMWSHSLYLSRMNSRCVHCLCCKSTSTRWKSGLRLNTHGVDKHHHVCLAFCIGCMCDLPQAITAFMWTTIVNFLSQGADHPMSTPCCVDRAGPVLAYRTMHLNDVASASPEDVLWLKNVSCEYNREWLKLNFAICVVPHQTRSYDKYGFCELNLRYDY